MTRRNGQSSSCQSPVGDETSGDVALLQKLCVLSRITPPSMPRCAQTKTQNVLSAGYFRMLPDSWRQLMSSCAARAGARQAVSISAPKRQTARKCFIIFLQSF